MIELTKGDMGHLVGKATVFCRLETQEEQKIIAVFLAVAPLDFIEKFGLPRSTIEQLEEALEAFREELQSLQSRIDVPYADAEIMKTFCARIEVENEEDLHAGEEDVLCMGTYSSEKLCLGAVQVGAQYYLLIYEDQVIRRHGLKEEVGEEKLLYTDIDKGSLERHVLTDIDPASGCEQVPSPSVDGLEDHVGEPHVPGSRCRQAGQDEGGLLAVRGVGDLDARPVAVGADGSAGVDVAVAESVEHLGGFGPAANVAGGPDPDRQLVGRALIGVQRVPAAGVEGDRATLGAEADGTAFGTTDGAIPMDGGGGVGRGGPEDPVVRLVPRNRSRPVGCPVER